MTAILETSRKVVSKLEKLLVVMALVYNAIYFPCFVFFSGGRVGAFLPFHVVAMLLVVLVVGLAFRDLYLRPFPSRTTKLKWLAVMVLIGPSIIVYIFRHAFKPRVSVEPEPC